MCEFKNFCVMSGGAACDGGFCDEKGRLTKLKNEKCPIMVGQGFADNICDCDMPFLLRALIPHNVSCVLKNQCIIAIHFPELREKACDSKFKPDRREIIRLAGMIKSKIRLSEPKNRANNSGQLSAPATV